MKRRRFTAADLKRKGVELPADVRAVRDRADDVFERLRLDPAWRPRDLPRCRLNGGEVGVAPDRLWRFDLAWPDLRLAVEIHGGTRGAAGRWGSHAGPGGLQNDCEKMNAAQMLGWVVLAFTDLDLDTRSWYVVEKIAMAYDRRRLCDICGDSPGTRCRCGRRCCDSCRPTHRCSAADSAEPGDLFRTPTDEKPPGSHGTTPPLSDPPSA